MEESKIAVLGTGAWGTVFAQILADAGHKVTMWGRDPKTVEAINAHENPKYVPDLRLSESIEATTDLPEAVREAAYVVVAVPTKAVGDVVRAARESNPSATYVALAKGIEVGTDRFVTEIMVETGGLDPAQVAVVSGPNLSKELAEKQPAAAVVASSDFDTARRFAEVCHNPYFRPYVSTDVIGVQVAGAAKNVIALAIGASEGMGYAVNTRATLITRGLAEITRLGIALGAEPETFAGIAGAGDLIATCSSRLSRNYTLGHRLGEGASLPEALSLSAGVAEGARTAAPMLSVADRLGVDMPITRGVVEVIEGRADVAEMGEMLLGRPKKKDGWQIELLE